MNGLLYRAVACVHGSDAPEVHVFFEAPPLTDPGNELLHMLSAVWYATDGTLRIENIVEEREYINRWAVGAPGTGDARLFETGFGDGGRVHYCQPGRTLFLVSPPVLARLARAQQVAEQLACAGYTVEPERVAA